MAKAGKDTAPAADAPAKDGAKATQVAADAKEAKKAKKVAAYKNGVKYVIAPGKSTLCKRGSLRPGDPVGADLFKRGEESLEFLVEKGVAIPAED
jgi:hypothetical protein